MAKITYDVLRQRQGLPLEAKVAMSQLRIRDWYEHWEGDVYISFSGGKDSTVLRHLVKGIYPDVPAVFCDTGLEYPELRSFAIENADVVLKPSMTFKAVIEKYGYPVVGKKQARMIRDLKHETEKNANVCNLHRTGYTRAGRYCPSYKLADKWMYLVDAPFEISEQCCDVMKKNPFKKYEKETERHPYIGTMACESNLRLSEYLRSGCNSFEIKRPNSTPIAFWTEQDILAYLKENQLEYASVYGDIVESDGTLSTTGEKRTGCMFCMFGVHLDDEPNRFQRMAKTHPNQYAYCIDKLGIGAVLDYVGIPYKYQPTLLEDYRGGIA